MHGFMNKFFSHNNLPQLNWFGKIFSFLIINGYWGVIKNPTFYQGPLKGITLPVLNCYSCPLAYTSCPIGLMQHFLEIRLVPYYLIGMISTIGVVFGQATCGWVCPFGLLQDILYKIPGRKVRIPHKLYYMKYLFLLVTIVLSIWMVSPVFCKYFCPAGTLEAGLPHIIWAPEFRPLLTWIFGLKFVLMIIFLLLFVFTKRPFCTTSCPMGAILGGFNKVSFLQMHVSAYKCTKCDICRTVCPMDISIWKNPKDLDCIRCGRCVVGCPANAIEMTFRGVKIAKLNVNPTLRKSDTQG
ncbi:hypothetical protein DRP43_01880 [candidate division TA06 bacterium]|uniref:4Fe-4S ferredoxin-type domain-containing protein n=1 Tax=candidate division TA06 bacterium TaxID=2250710 RepID=A0A660SNA2_UNCT6|nr:MAG: hypothetical protein DRP43_01880 [candidate division TA06 bacterium]